MLNKELVNRTMELLEKAEGHYVVVNIWGGISTVLLFNSLDAYELEDVKNNHFIRLADREDADEFSFDVDLDQITDVQYILEEDFTIYLNNNLALNFSVE